MIIPPGKVGGYHASTINGIIDTLNAIIPRSNATVKVTTTPRGTTFEIPSLKRIPAFYPFELSVSGDEIRVEVGKWTRNGTVLSLEPDTDKTWKTITGPAGGGAWSASTDYIVYLELDDYLNPTTVTVAADETLPADSGNKYFALGLVGIDSDSKCKQPVQWWLGGDIDDADGGGSYKRFRLDYVDASTVVVRAGYYTVNGKQGAGTGWSFEKGDISITADGNDIDGFVTPWANGGHYVYIEKFTDDGSTDPTLYPDNIKIVCNTSFPQEAELMRQRYWLLGSFATADQEVVAGSVVVNWIGDIDELTVVTDGDRNNPLAVDIKTLQYRQIDDGGQGEIEMFGAHSATLATTEAWTSKIGIPGLPKNAGGAGDLVWYGVDTEATGPGTQKSIQITGGAFQIYNMDQPADNGIGSGEVAYRTAQAGEISFTDFDDMAEAVGLSPDFDWDHTLEIHTDYAGGTAKAEGAMIRCTGGTQWDWKVYIEVDPGDLRAGDKVLVYRETP